MNNLTFLIFQGNEIVWIVVAILVLFGGSKIPELMKGLGSGIKEFKKATKDEDKTDSSNQEKSNQ